MAEAPQKITAIVSILSFRRERHTAGEKPGRRLSKYEEHGDGRIEIREVIQGEAPVPKKKPLVISFERDSSKHVRYKRGTYLQVEGVIEPLTKNEDILYVLKSCIPTDIGERFFSQRFHVSAQEKRNELVKSGEGFQLSDNLEGLPAELHQDPLALQEFLVEHGFNQDLDFAANLCAHFARRVRNRKEANNVPEMIRTNPLILSDIHYMDKSFTTGNIIRQFNLKSGNKSLAYAEVILQLNRARQRGDTFLPLGQLVGYTRKFSPDKNAFKFLMDVLVGDHSLDKGFFSMAKVSCFTFSPKQAKTGHARFEGMSSGAAMYFAGKLDEESPDTAGENESKAERLVFRPVVYLIKDFFTEKCCAEQFARHLGKAEDVFKELMPNPKFTEEQQTAVRNAFRYYTSVVTGSAGCGKTAVVSEIVRIAEENKKNVILLAPSAKAALHAAAEVHTNVPDAEHVEHQTIHRFAHIMIEDEDAGESGDFRGTEEVENRYDFLIIDEMSMCNLPTFYRVLKAVKSSPNIHIVLVGDPMQLPAIGPQFFHQLVDGLAPNLPVVSLTKNFRARSDTLSSFSEEIRHGSLPKPDGVSVHVESSTIDAFRKKHIDLLQDEDTMFLTSRRDDAMKLNEMLRKIRHPEAAQVGSKGFFIGDRVISVENDYYDEGENASSLRHPDRKVDIFNGTEGVIEGWDEKTDTVRVRMFSPEFSNEGQIVCYRSQELSRFLTPAYAITVHRAQGSQYPRVVFFMPHNVTTGISRNLLYTAVTRAEKEIYLVGEPEQFQDAVSRMAHFGNSFFSFYVRTELDTKPVVAKERDLVFEF